MWSNRLIFGGALLGVFLITFVLGHQNTFDKYLGFLGVTVINSPDNRGDIGDRGDKPAVSPSDMVTKMVTRSLSPMSPRLSPTPSTNPQISTSTIEPTPKPQVVINEIGWMGTVYSANDEWLELYNAGENKVTLTGWHLKAADGSPDIVLNGSMAAGTYYLIERTNDTTISDISADLISSFGHGLSNNGENLVLTDAKGNIVDSVNCAGGWFAGDSAKRASMARLDPLASGDERSNWRTSTTAISGHDNAGNPIIGSPRQPNGN